MLKYTFNKYLQCDILVLVTSDGLNKWLCLPEAGISGKESGIKSLMPQDYRPEFIFYRVTTTIRANKKKEVVEALTSLPTPFDPVGMSWVSQFISRPLFSHLHNGHYRSFSSEDPVSLKQAMLVWAGSRELNEQGPPSLSSAWVLHSQHSQRLSEMKLK